MRGLQSFYRSFYGDNFFRHFRRPPDYYHDKFRIQFTVNSPKKLYLHVARNSGHHPCFIHVYDNGSFENLKRGKTHKMNLDRAFFDFDVSNHDFNKLKTELISLRRQGPFHEIEKQLELVTRLNELIIDDRIVEGAINEVKDFAIEFEKTFAAKPILFFSGCKGCHVYTFFPSSRFENLNRAISWFAENIKKSKGYDCLDLSVNRDAVVRLSRVPYSKHQLTGLTVVPFTVEDTYDDIMEKSRNPYVESFDRFDYTGNFNDHLWKIDQLESHNSKVRKKMNNSDYSLNKDLIHYVCSYDHRVLFKSILGSPVREYPEKKYVMYHCPLDDHDDKRPSFMVHKNGYYCYGCQRKGNYWQFLEYYQKI